MGARGRKSTGELSVIAPKDVRPSPPKDLTKEQAAEWRAIVDRMPADWFPRETHQLLAQYCRHAVTSRRIATLVNAMEKEDDIDPAEYERLLKMHDREGRAMSSLATRMRISQQATYDKTKGRNAGQTGGATKKPWE